MDSSLFSQEYDKNLETLKQKYQQHGKRVHHYDFSSCPIWAIAEVISFGQLSRWYGDTTRQVRQLVARHYQLAERIFRSLLRHLATVRNFCAHHERLWDRDFITKFTIPKRLGTFPDPRLFFNRVDDGKLYNTLVMIAHLTSRLRKKGVSVKLPCKLSPELDDIRPKRVLKSRTLLFSW